MAILAIGVLKVSAQKKSEEAGGLKFSVGLEAALPVGDLKTGYSFGIGGSVQADYKLAENFAVTLNAGYLNFIGKTVFGLKIPSTGLIPILAGGKYHFTESIYGSAQLGLTFSTEKNGGSAFTYAPGIGYNVSPNFDLLLKYQASSKNGSTSSFLGLRAAYSF